MKNATVIITFNAEKMDALNFHMGKRDANLQAELNDTVQKLYEKYVPQATREYIDDKVSRESEARDRPRRLNRPARASGTVTQPETVSGREESQSSGEVESGGAEREV